MEKLAITIHKIVAPTACRQLGESCQGDPALQPSRDRYLSACWAPIAKLKHEGSFKNLCDITTQIGIVGSINSDQTLSLLYLASMRLIKPAAGIPLRTQVPVRIAY